MFVGKAGAYPSEAPDSFVNYVRKKLYRIGPWGMYYKILRIRYLRKRGIFSSKLGFSIVSHKH